MIMTPITAIITVVKMAMMIVFMIMLLIGQSYLRCNLSSRSTPTVYFPGRERGGLFWGPTEPGRVAWDLDSLRATLEPNMNKIRVSKAAFSRRNEDNAE